MVERLAVQNEIVAYRDVLFTPLVSAFLVSGLDPETVEALPAALSRILRNRRSRRSTSPLAKFRRGAALERNALAEKLTVDRHGPEVSDAELIRLAHAGGTAGLPVGLALSRDRCVLLTAHRTFDGTGSLQLLHDLLDDAAGASPRTEKLAARLPLLSALNRVRPRDLRNFVDARRGRPESPPASASPVPRRSTSAAFELHRDDLRAVRLYREPGRSGRATLLSRLASLIVAALREVATSDVDIPVWMTSDIRHLVDGAVDGNFITRELVGTLHGEQWAPGALAARMTRLKEPGQALALVWGPTGWLLRSLLGRKPVAGEEIVLTLATTQRSFPVPVESVLATSIGGSPTFGFALQTKDSVYVSVYNSSGRFDLDRFEAVFRRIVAERAGMTAG